MGYTSLILDCNCGNVVPGRLIAFWGRTRSYFPSVLLRSDHSGAFSYRDTSSLFHRLVPLL
eukprot:6298166-Amphidinium_carterae.1